MPSWVCLSVNTHGIKKDGSLEKLKEDIKRAFDGDFLDFVAVGDWYSDASAEISDNYAFVKCNDYFAHVKKIRECRVIAGVLDSYDNPIFSSEQEISSFRKNLSERPVYDYCCGDFVKIKDGYLKDLFGLICGKHGKNNYKVMFRFYTKKFTKPISPQNMIFISNISHKKK